jgi:fatty-acid desaturase
MRVRVALSSEGTLTLRFQCDVTTLIAPWFARLLRLFIGHRVGESLQLFHDIVVPLSEDMDAAWLMASLAHISHSLPRSREEHSTLAVTRVAPH